MKAILKKSLNLVNALVDVISTCEHYAQIICAMRLSQMIVQSCWDTDSPLCQLPHFSAEILRACRNRGIKEIYDLTELDEADRNSLLGLSEGQIEEVAGVCNIIPDL